MSDLVFAPLLPWGVIIVLACLFVLLGIFAQRRGLGGALLRSVSGFVLLAALANPSYKLEEREPLPDIVLAMVDRSSSQTLSDRASQTSAAVEHLRGEVERLGNSELQVVELNDAEANGGTQLLGPLRDTLAVEPSARVAGIFLVTDGQVHDSEIDLGAVPAPVYVLLSGNDTEFDRVLTIENAPAYAILGEPFRMVLRVNDLGPEAEGIEARTVPLRVSVDGASPINFDIPVNQDIEVPVSLTHPGTNVLQFDVPSLEGELTDRNNTAIIQINGVRDRLRVLLVSGVPHPGERTWRNLLKSDSAVDLVHFTILRPPGKQDGTPVTELSLIAFPTRELFVEKIEEFDLIILDRYKRRGLLPSEYFENIRRYVERGGALLVAAGPDYAGADSVFRSPLEGILPGVPTARVIEREVLPLLTETGARHPVTSGWQGADAETPDWGPWLRQIEVTARDTARVVLDGVDGAPLLMLDDAGQGRVALLASDQAWLWDRGYAGGGPQSGLLRGVAHWLMKEPELEEEALRAEINGKTLRIIRRTLADTAGPVTVTEPDGEEATIMLSEQSVERFEAFFEAQQEGLYRLNDGSEETVIAVGPAAPREFEETLSTAEVLSPLAGRSGGGVYRLQDGLPDIRTVREGRVAAGRGWMGIVPREAYRVVDMRLWPLLPGWLTLLLAGLALLAAWLIEGRWQRRQVR